ncbi:MAG: hypothetical protein H7839_16595, partial [Magnetococcus sp. YQC-5]
PPGASPLDPTKGFAPGPHQGDNPPGPLIVENFTSRHGFGFSHAWMGVMVLLMTWAEVGWSAPAVTSYQDCLLRHVKPAKSELAAFHLQQACKRHYAAAHATGNQNVQPSSIQEIRQDKDDDFSLYDNCLLQHLPDVKNDQSAKWMIQFCQDQFYPVNAPTSATATQGGMLEILRRIDGSHPQPNPTSAPLIDGETFVPLTPAKAGR